MGSMSTVGVFHASGRGQNRFGWKISVIKIQSAVVDARHNAGTCVSQYRVVPDRFNACNVVLNADVVVLDLGVDAVHKGYLGNLVQDRKSTRLNSSHVAI